MRLEFRTGSRRVSLSRIMLQSAGTDRLLISLLFYVGLFSPAIVGKGAAAELSPPTRSYAATFRLTERNHGLATARHFYFLFYCFLFSFIVHFR